MVKRENRLKARGLILLLVIIGVTVCGMPAYAQAQDSSEQTTDLTGLSIDELMNIEVASTATLTKTAPRLVPAAVTTVTEEQIKASGARSLFELLDIYVPNLQWMRAHWEADHLGLRGIMNDRDDKYLMLVNGRVMNERTHYGALSERDLVLLRDIHHIDIVRGPGSALYGPGAVSMVINIITHNANTFKGTEITSRLGAVEQFYSAELKHSIPSDDNDGGLFIYGGIAEYSGASRYDAPQVYAVDFPTRDDPLQDWGGNNPYGPWDWYGDGYQAGDTFSGAPVPNDGESHRNLPPLKMHVEFTRDNWDIWARYTRGGQQFVWTPQEIARLPLGYTNWAYLDWGNATWWPTIEIPLTEFPDMYVHSYGYEQLTGYIGHKLELADDIDLDYSFSYDRFYFVRVLGKSDDPSDDVANDYREDKYIGKAILKWQVNEQHRAAFGTEILHSEFGYNNPMWPVAEPHTNLLAPMSRWSTNMYSLLGEWQWTISDKWTTFAGARLDDHTYTDWMFSPRAAVVHTPTDRDTLKLMWSRSVRTNLEEELKAAGDNSDPEKLDSVEFRFERQQTQNFDLAASLFVHYSLSRISWDGSTAQNTIIGTQKDWGIELEASYHTDKTRLTASHGYTKLYDFTLEPGKDSTIITAMPYGYGDDLANWANHITKLTLQQKLNDQWTFDASMRIYWGFPGLKDVSQYGASLTSNPSMEQGWEKGFRGSYFLNLGLQYKPSNDLTIGITGYNLLGIFDKDLNKRNYLSDPDYRSQAAAVGVWVEYKF